MVADEKLVLFEHQERVQQYAKDQKNFLRLCLYFPTGTGKTLSCLLALQARGVQEVLIIAPPITAEGWMVAALSMGITPKVVSHQKFRMSNFKPSKKQAIIVDEFHLLGGRTALGLKKLMVIAPHLQADLVIASATPYYNTAERVYGIMRVLAPEKVRGGYLAFLHTYCETEYDPFSQLPKVVAFKDFEDATELMLSMPNVLYVEDSLEYEIEEVRLDLRPAMRPWRTWELDEYGLHRSSSRIVASTIERYHLDEQDKILGWDSSTGKRFVFEGVMTQLLGLIPADGRALVFLDSKVVALAVSEALPHITPRRDAMLITGDTSAADRSEQLADFIATPRAVLVGTTALATGLDGLDKICDTLIILSDVRDSAKRRQLVGRIMPRGGDTDTSKKKIYRFNIQID